MGGKPDGIKRVSEWMVGAGDVHFGQVKTYVWSQQQSPPHSHFRHPAQPTVKLHIQCQGPDL